NKVVVLEDDAYTLKNIKADATVEAFFKRIVGIDENELNILVFSYANVVTIKNENLVPVKQVEIMDMFGRVVWKGQANTETTEITLNVAAGIYAVRIIMEENQQIITKVSIN
ncbi:MAG: T9SS type A sorting domain-containing protein, partial [Lentimicrobiaceae bacterium]|nr:T9SS type A sorting domain-containing protein [Lentimicrobiaceae bacterium]